MRFPLHRCVFSWRPRASIRRFSRCFMKIMCLLGSSTISRPLATISVAIQGSLRKTVLYNRAILEEYFTGIINNRPMLESWIWPISTSPKKDSSSCKITAQNDQPVMPVHFFPISALSTSNFDQISESDSFGQNRLVSAYVRWQCLANKIYFARSKLCNWLD